MDWEHFWPTFLAALPALLAAAAAFLQSVMNGMKAERAKTAAETAKVASDTARTAAEKAADQAAVVEKKLDQNTEETIRTHQIVNDQRTVMVERIAELEKLLREEKARP